MKAASMTTPLISITLPTFCSGMRMGLLEGRNRATSEAPRQRGQSSEALLSRLVRLEELRLLVGLHQRRHTFGVIEASDVRADEGWDRHETHDNGLEAGGSVTPALLRLRAWVPHRSIRLELGPADEQPLVARLELALH